MTTHDDRWPDPELVEIAKLVLSDDLFARERLDEETIAEYSEAMQEDDQRFPAIRVIRLPGGGPLWVVDGWHRVEAAKRAKFSKMRASIREGKWANAVLAAVGSNTRHGLRRSNADKRRVVEMLLELPEWAEASDREVARRCGVSHPFVADVRCMGIEKLLALPEWREASDLDIANRCNVSTHLVTEVRTSLTEAAALIPQTLPTKGNRYHPDPDPPPSPAAEEEREPPRMVEPVDPRPVPPPHTSHPEDNGRTVRSPSVTSWPVMDRVEGPRAVATSTSSRGSTARTTRLGGSSATTPSVSSFRLRSD